MRALKRDEEIIPEPFDQWTMDHLDWMITPRPEGNGYTLIDEYQSEEESSE